MTIEFFTGFEGCGTTAEVKALFDEIAGTSAYSATGGWANGKSFYASEARKNCAHAKTKVAGLHFNPNGINGTLQIYFNGPDIRIGSNRPGEYISASRGATELGRAEGLATGLLHHIEAKVFSSATVGTVQVKFNGVLVLDLSGQNTEGSDITSVSWLRDHSVTRKDNVFIASDWKGELKSLLLKPNADDSVQFTKNAGTYNYDRINQAASDADTTYNSSGTVGHKDIFGYEDITAGLVPLAVTFVTRARKDDTGARELEQFAVQDAVEYTQGTKLLNTDYIPLTADNLVKTLGLAPDGTAWSLAKFNAIKWGYKVAA